MNLIMGPVTETMRTNFINPQSGREECQVRMSTNFQNIDDKDVHIKPYYILCLQTTERAIELLFVRGDGVILVSPVKGRNSKSA